jgi:hypothetical protein
MKALEKFSLPWEIYMLVTGEKRLCTYNELQTIYDTQDMYDMLEMLDVSAYIEECARKKAERQANSNKR